MACKQIRTFKLYCPCLVDENADIIIVQKLLQLSNSITGPWLSWQHNLFVHQTFQRKLPQNRISSYYLLTTVARSNHISVGLLTKESQIFLDRSDLGELYRNKYKRYRILGKNFGLTTMSLSPNFPEEQYSSIPKTNQSGHISANVFR